MYLIQVASDYFAAPTTQALLVVAVLDALFGMYLALRAGRFDKTKALDFLIKNVGGYGVGCFVAALVVGSVPALSETLAPYTATAGLLALTLSFVQKLQELQAPPPPATVVTVTATPAEPAGAAPVVTVEKEAPRE